MGATGGLSTRVFALPDEPAVAPDPQYMIGKTNTFSLPDRPAPLVVARVGRQYNRGFRGSPDFPTSRGTLMTSLLHPRRFCPRFLAWVLCLSAWLAARCTGRQERDPHDRRRQRKQHLAGHEHVSGKSGPASLRSVRLAKAVLFDVSLESLPQAHRESDFRTNRWSTIR